MNTIEYEAFVGVGDGTGQSFVYGKYEDIKKVQSIILENEKLKLELEYYKKYADTLVDHANLPCLPADLRNLRQANYDLSIENENLKKENDRLKRKIYGELD
jgi:regulator of replication initiation timing